MTIGQQMSSSRQVLTEKDDFSEHAVATLDYGEGPKKQRVVDVQQR